ncbi:acyltransferase [Caballeronia sp. LjRoot34]|uniref:acyltransferase family protein n=1 Tax=Caballeronia sp. LjRoot34 TaxID=3342325 RepID=UPI003ED00D97
MLLPRPKITLSQRVEDVGAASSGFDYMRIGLAASILCWHTIYSLYGAEFEQAYWDKYRMVVGGMLPMFFVLSGFLVSGSLVRTGSIGKFLSLRAIRLYPALAVEVLLSALILGPLLTTLPLSAYFSSGTFWAYFHNIIGYITYPLPGLFSGNPVPDVTNVSLWTIPFELECYACLTLIALFGLQTRRLLLLMGLIALIVLKTYGLARLGDSGQFVAPPGRLLVASFLAGVVAYFYRDKIPYSSALFAVALLLQLLLTRNAVTAYLAVIPTAYVTVYLGLLNPPKYTFLMRGDYSYGLYLFAFPIQQTYALLFPQHRVWWLSIGFSLSLGLAYAAFSWHLIEKPILRRKNEIISRITLAVTTSGRILSAKWRRNMQSNVPIVRSERSDLDAE